MGVAGRICVEKEVVSGHRFCVDVGKEADSVVLHRRK